MRYGSVCSGIEAATVAWHPLGWRPVFFSQFDPEHSYKHGPDFPSAVLAHHYPDVPNLGDMTKFEAWSDADIDVLVGGTPCQDFSVAGLRAGLDGERGNLMLVYAAIARRYRPKWLVWENVPGVLSSNEGRDFGSLLGLLSGQRIEVPPGGWQSAGVVPGIERAYGLAWRVLDAQFVRVDGFGRAVPQRRRRVFVVGGLGDWRRAAAVLFERASLSGNPPPGREARQDVALSIDASSARRRGSGMNPNQLAAVSHTLNAKGGVGRLDYESETLVAHSLRGGGFDASEDGTGRGTPLVPVAGTLQMGRKSAGSATTQDALQGLLLPVPFDETQITSKTNRCQPRAGDPSHPLAAGARPPTIAFNARQDPIFGPVSPPLDVDDYTVGVFSSWRVRRLMPVECERLQGFPDGYTDIPWRKKNWTPDGPRYKAVGNSMSANCMRWLGTRIDMVERRPQ